MREHATRRRRLRAPGLVSVSLVLAMTLAACTAEGAPPQDSGDSSTDDSASVEIVDGESASVRAGAVSVQIAARNLTGGGTLTARPADPPRGGLPGLTAIGPGVDVTLSGVDLTGPATVRFDVPDGWAAKDLVPVVVWEDEGGWRWLPTEIQRDGSVAVARAPHFSEGFLGGFDAGAFAKESFGKVVTWASGRSGVAQPRCEDEAAAREEIDVASDHGDSVKWCLGREGGRTILRVANNRLLYTQVSYPDSWTNLTGSKVGISLDRALVAAGTSIEQLAYRRAERTVYLLEPGAVMTIAVPDGASDRVTAKGTPAAFFLQTLRTALEMLTTLRGFAKVGANAPAADKVFAMLGEGKGDNLAWASAAQSCLVSFTESFTDDMTEPVTGPGQLRKAAQFAMKCGAEIGAASLTDSGPLAWLTSAAVATVINVYSIASSLVTHLVGAGREVFDGVRSLTTDVDDAAYDIVIVSSRDVPAELLGTYYVHGGSLTVSADATARGTSSYCMVDRWAAQGCLHVVEYDVEATGDRSLRLTVTAEYYESRSGRREDDTDRFVVPGDYYTLEAREPGFYVTRLYGADGTAKTAPDDANNLGNPWLCRSEEVEDPTLARRCGA